MADKNKTCLGCCIVAGLLVCWCVRCCRCVSLPFLFWGGGKLPLVAASFSPNCNDFTPRYTHAHAWSLSSRRRPFSTFSFGRGSPLFGFRCLPLLSCHPHPLWLTDVSFSRPPILLPLSLLPARFPSCRNRNRNRNGNRNRNRNRKRTSLPRSRRGCQTPACRWCRPASTARCCPPSSPWTT